MSQRRPTGRTEAAEIEWTCGTVTMPGYAFGERGPYRPEGLVWSGADGDILASILVHPDELLSSVVESLGRTIEEPMHGPPHSPTRVRVASAELADALRAGHPGIEVVCAPTPEMDEVLAIAVRVFQMNADEETSYLSPEVTPEAMASLFEACAALFRVEPWKRVPSPDCVFSVTIEPLGVHDAAMCVVGQLDERFGLLLFSSYDDFKAYRRAGEGLALGEKFIFPSHLALGYQLEAKVSSGQRAEVAEHGWEIAAPNAYPRLLFVAHDLVVRPPTREEVTRVDAVATALSLVMAEHEALDEAWESGVPLIRTLPVASGAGEVEVTIGAPYMDAVIELDPERDLIADLAALARPVDELDREACEPFEDALLRRFAASPEAEKIDGIDACYFVMDLAARFFRDTIATLRAEDLREIIFELIPHKMSIKSSKASLIIEECRAFYRFLKREFGLEQADAGSCGLTVGILPSRCENRAMTNAPRIRALIDRSEVRV